MVCNVGFDMERFIFSLEMFVELVELMQFRHE